MSTTAAIPVPLSVREVYASAAPSALGAACATDAQLSTKPVEGIRPAGQRAGAMESVPRRAGDSRPRAESDGAFSGPKSSDVVPFLVQRLAQEGGSSFEDDGEEDAALPSVRFAAAAAYGAARDSTVEYLSPTPLFDLQV